MADEHPDDELARKRRERELNPKPAGTSFRRRRQGQAQAQVAVPEGREQVDLSNAPYHAGQFVRCMVLSAEPGGYTVLVEGIFAGFLPTEKQLASGAELDVQFVCMSSNGRMLLTPPMTRKGQ
jgi:hypothetical protein